ncbi:sodium:solute symporter [Rheinheimera tilapiae]|uniref:Sodium/solute symporter n=1 Tax=Rheinheimera tilapiae TaxID=875043 RepID=A0ABV6BCH3_9GAMM
MRKCLLLLIGVWLLISSPLVFASNFLEWKNDQTSSLVNVAVGDGASLVQQQGTTILLPGIQLEPQKQLYILNGKASKPVLLLDSEAVRPYAVAVSYKEQIIIVGGQINGLNTAAVNWLKVSDNGSSAQATKLPDLPRIPTQLAGSVLNDHLYVLLQADGELRLFKLALAEADKSGWQELNAPAVQGVNSMTLAVQHDGRGYKLYANLQAAASSTWSFDPDKPNSSWSELKTRNAPAVNIKSLYPLGQAHLLAVSDSGATFHYNTITRAWAAYEQADAATGSVVASLWTDQELIYLTRQDIGLSVHKAVVAGQGQEFGWLNMLVLTLYLVGVVLLGLYFMNKNKNTNDFFRGGQSIPWWGAACSIYATMLSSLTYMALPAIVYQTDWVLLIGILTIVAVAPVAVYVAIPFFRQIDATSAYEYLSKRFNMGVRLFASALFTLFHLSRMGVVMALTALAIAAITPFSATESVLLMGVLCLLYCTLGGIEAVIWTDTLQTVVLLMGAIVCFVVLVSGVDGGISEFVTVGFSDDKFTLWNADFSSGSITTLSIWVIVLGGIGQNLSSYTADQAIVQRYMVTPDPEAAKKSIWANAIIAAPSSVLFFCIGTGLYLFYQAHPAQLNPTAQIDQIFPTFIVTQLPAGLAGLIIAGIFAAAQSTVSTSINSMATTLVTDFVRPSNLVKTEKGYMRAAQLLTFIVGVIGTCVGLVFIDPAIRSLMDTYFVVIGMFMGALGGLFVLGVVTRRANGVGAMVGLVVGVSIMVLCWKYNLANGYLYCTIGIVSCVVVGYLASLMFPGSKKDLAGLTLFTMQSTQSAAPKSQQPSSVRSV